MLEGGDYIFQKAGDGTITGGGFSVGNILNRYGGVVTFNSTCGQKGGNVADMFQGLVVPFGLFSQHGGKKEKPNEYLEDDSDDDDVISDKLHDELLNLAKPTGNIMTISILSDLCAPHKKTKKGMKTTHLSIMQKTLKESTY